MSGICGIVRFNGKPIEKEEIQKMLDSMQFCSDTEGLYVNGNIGFGHKMLWTTPESLYEDQPLASRNSDIIVTADVRLDNRDELFDQLKIKKNGSETVTDTDLVLLSYMKWHKEYPKYLKGDFSIAIWDSVRNELLLTRDRFANRPLYFCKDGSFLYFSSHIDALLLLKTKRENINYESVKSFSKYATIKYEDTFYASIHRVPPAFCFSFKECSFLRDRYWFPEKIDVDYSISFESAKKKIRELLSKAVNNRLRIYGEFACELSGGLDSTAVALLAKKKNTIKFKTFSMRYQSYSCDEWKYTFDVINELESKPIILDVDKLDLSKKFHLYNTVQMNKHYPLYGSFAFNSALGEEMVKNNIRVCLTGHGGDHVLTGSFDALMDYAKNFRFKNILDDFKCSDEPLSQYLYRNLKSIAPKKAKNFIKNIIRLQSTKAIAPENFTDYWDIHNIKSSSLKSQIYAIAGRQHVMHTDNNHYRALEGQEPIEFRHPFLDTDLIEYVLTLPNFYKCKYGTIKFILRESLKDLYPSSIYSRNDKAEFSEALLAQLKEVDIKEILEYSNLVYKNIIDRAYLRTLVDRYDNDKIDAEDIGKLWRIVCLELWLKNQLPHC